MGGPVFNQSVEGVDLDEPRKGYGVGGFSARAGGRGVFGQSEEGIGVHGTSSISYGVHGHSDTSYGVFGDSNNYPYAGVNGESYNSIGVRGYSVNRLGVFGDSIYGYGVLANSGNADSVHSYSGNGYDVFAHSNTSYGVYGRGYENYGVYASSGTSYGLYASSDTGLAARLEGKVTMTSDVNMTGPVNMTGSVTITGPLTKPGGQFKIDHPLDPANKYLSHSFVESPDMKNVYDGVVVLDDKGEAEIELPDWFGALNKDFRYQLTAIGAPGPNLYISEEISDGVIISYSNTSSSNGGCNSRFKIAGGTSGMKVSWQVTGVRKDPWANAHRIRVEEDKPAKERGYYTYPELYGQPEERGISRLLFPTDKEKENVMVVT